MIRFHYNTRFNSKKKERGSGHWNPSTPHAACRVLLHNNNIYYITISTLDFDMLENE